MKKQTKFSLWYYLIIVSVLLALQLLFFAKIESRPEISYKTFKDKVTAGEVARVVILPDRIVGQFKEDKAAGDSASAKLSSGPTAPWRLQLLSIEKEMARQFTVMRLPDMRDDKLLELLDAAGVDYSGKIESNFLTNFLLNWFFPLLIMIGIWGYAYQRMSIAGKGIMSFGRSKAKIHAENPQNRVTFQDVAGVDEAVEEVKELVEFLKNPKKFTRLGGKLPKGVLLVGPPGTGKTLLARAMAGEANVPFFNLSGSDFVEMFVGVGAARVRDLFQQAKEKAPCIIFIDEIDAIGKSRGRVAAIGGGYDERENTLNQLLAEMDGFDPSAGVLIIGATNRPEVLDPALLRPGRFDRQVLVDRPDLNGRVAIFKVHTRNLKLAADVDLKRLASQTPGLAGAEIANVCNEAALLAARKDKAEITMREFEEAIERVIAGLEKKNKLINERERKIVAYHESGHAIVGYFTPGADTVQKVSIVPRGIGALGYTLQMPLEDRYLMSKSELLGKVKGLLGGRAAEEIIFGEISTGASNDLEKVAQIARNMIVAYGMSEQLPNRALVQQLRIKLTHVNAIRWNRYRHIALVDTQPDFGNHSLPADIKPTVVIDHHPANKTTPARFEDIRPDYGATATILWEYLTAAELEMTADLATAVAYAIRTETQELGRDISPQDVEAYLKVYPKASKKKLAKIVNPKLPKSYFLLLQTAFQNAKVFHHAAHVHLGEVESPELAAQIADLLLRHERISWALATGRFDEQLFVSMRSSNTNAHAGKILQQIIGKMGTAGGHAMMAGGRIPLNQSNHGDWQDLESLVITRFLQQLRYGKNIEWKPLLGEESGFPQIDNTNHHNYGELKTGIATNDLTISP